VDLTESNGSLPLMALVTCGLTSENRDQLRNPSFRVVLCHVLSLKKGWQNVSDLSGVMCLSSVCHSSCSHSDLQPSLFFSILGPSSSRSYCVSCIILSSDLTYLCDQDVLLWRLREPDKGVGPVKHGKRLWIRV